VRKTERKKTGEERRKSGSLTEISIEGKRGGGSKESQRGKKLAEVAGGIP